MTISVITPGKEELELLERVGSVVKDFWMKSKRPSNETFSCVVGALLNMFTSVFVLQVQETVEEKTKLFDEVMVKVREVFLMKMAQENKDKEGRFAH
jgi:hypothetical protein